MKSSLLFIVRLFSFLYSYKLHRKLVDIYNSVYSAWISKDFYYFGTGAKIYHGVYLVNPHLISLGDKAVIGQNSFLTAFESESVKEVKIIIGENSVFGCDCHFSAISGIIIGKNVRGGKSILISDNSHGNPANLEERLLPPKDRPIFSKGGINIGDNVWIGEKVAILGNVSVGNNVIIGANAVVTKSIPDNVIVAGVPAKIIK